MRFPKDVWITLIVLVSMVSLFVTLVWWPSHQKINQHEARIQGAAERFAQVSASEAELLRLQQDVADLQELLAADEHVVPDTPQLSFLLRGLTESVRDQGVEDQELNAQEFERFADYSVIPASVRFSSSFLEAAGVIEAVETQRRLTALNRTTLRSRAGRPGQGVSSELELVAYYTTDTEVTP